MSFNGGNTALYGIVVRKLNTFLSIFAKVREREADDGLLHFIISILNNVGQLKTHTTQTHTHNHFIVNKLARDIVLDLR